MAIDAALYSGSKCYFFRGSQYIRVTRGDTGAGTVDPGYPRSIGPNWGWPGGFGASGIDAALYSGSKCYFFRGSQYIRVTRGDTGAGTVDPGYPRSIGPNWGWPGGFGASGIDAALYSGSKCYFFRGSQYIRVTRGDIGAGTVDPGYPRSIGPNWGWPGGFGASGIDAALYSGSKCYFFRGSQYIRVTRGDIGAGTVDPGYPRSIGPNWGWDREAVMIHWKSLLPITSSLRDYIDQQTDEMRRLFAGRGIDVRVGSTEDLSGDSTLNSLLVLDVGACLLGSTTQEQQDLFENRNGVGDNELVVYVVDSLQGGTGNFVGCASSPSGRPGCVVADNINGRWLTAHEVGHVLGLRHVSTTPTTNSDFLMWPNIAWTNVPPDVTAVEAQTMRSSSLTRPVPFG